MARLLLNSCQKIESSNLSVQDSGIPFSLEDSSRASGASLYLNVTMNDVAILLFGLCQNDGYLKSVSIPLLALEKEEGAIESWDGQEMFEVSFKTDLWAPRVLLDPNVEHSLRYASSKEVLAWKYQGIVNEISWDRPLTKRRIKISEQAALLFGARPNGEFELVGFQFLKAQ